MHPIIRKWVQRHDSHTISFDYCQFGTPWKNATTILSVGNQKFHTGNGRRCKVVYSGKQSICSRTGKFHETPTGFVNGATKGQYKTNRACPYPEEFCEYVADSIAQPQVHFTKTSQQGEIHTTARDELSGEMYAMAIGPAVAMDPPPASHYITHLPNILAAKHA